ncbi:hypothetical protein ACFQZX_17785 [Mucilaginibacter litoreus]|uniref:Uncharacterized protein n=1 Tax=Mucilaginibacter litoreus TaxID=1048221 RepID=A0ABW3AY55_9SPHI
MSVNKNIKLIHKQNKFIEDLETTPIENDIFVATFNRLTPRSGEVYFDDKIYKRRVTAQWGVYIDKDCVKATLSSIGDLIYDNHVKNFKDFIKNKVIIKNPLDDLKSISLKSNT